MENLFLNQKLAGLFLHSCLQFADCCFTRILRGLVVSFTFIALPTLLLLPAFTNGNDATGKYILQQMQSSLSITGKVTDEGGLPLEGVTVQVKGQTTYTTTDATGSFVINVPSSSAVLVFSYIGMQTLERQVPASGVMTAELKQDQSTLSDVVVVGYGTQKKQNLTGSVASVSGNTLVERPATNAANLLQGRVTGLQVVQPTASPGRDDPQFQIRGLGSFGASSNPLVLVDGLIGSINNLNPNDIESVSVLKDAASAAIYGSRAANGVILVTTKQGKKGAPLLEYRIDMGSHSATRLPDFIYNSVEYMTMYNAAKERVGLAPLYTQEQIDAYKNPTDPDQYPNFNWTDHYFKPAAVFNHNLRFSGGNERTNYSISLGYLDQDGILPVFNYKRYNAIINLNSKINERVKIGAIVNMVKKRIHEPRNVNSDVVLLVYQGSPNFTPFLPDGSGRIARHAYIGEGHNRNPETDLHPGNYQHSNSHAINAQGYVDVQLLKGLVWQVKGGFNYNGDTYKSHQQEVPQYGFLKPPGAADYPYIDDGGKSGGVTDRYTQGVLPSLFSTLNYTTTLGKAHNINVLAGYEQQAFKTQFLQGSRLTFPTPSLAEINAGSPTGQSLSGTSTEWSLRSYFGRVSYDYEGKYLLEGNFRYDGSSRIASENRWGAFPSVSAGWRISRESFIQDKITWLDDLKIRGSFGTLGNQEIGLYPYQDILNLTEYPYGSSLQPATTLTRLTDKNIKWESTRVVNLGLDLEISKGLFGLTFDWFKKNTYDILTTQPVPGSLGLGGPVTNDGKLQNIGWETQLRHTNQIGEFGYSGYFLFSTFKNELLKIRVPTKGVNEVGLPYGSYYMYEWVGIFQSQDDIDRSPSQPFFPPSPGDLKIKDQNGDGVVNADDRVTVKGRFPDFTYSFGGNASWKGFGLSVFFQGTKGNKMPLNGWGIDPFIQGTPPTTKFRDAWSPTNPSNTVPAIYESWTYGGVSAYPSTYYLQDASYLRLKNVNLSYMLPKRVTDRLWSKGITVYVSGDNLLTFTKFEGADPETLSRTGSTISGWGRFAQFPQVRIINFGVDVKF
ncbi:MAG: TonB-dependent receptor [Chitinophagaceae bacterium]|nr:TonB-dependent receptor [Chitinophagaceae bacterium]MCW5926051.1 TonB-dependent receptor [Chitinophagaceae bacterium]